MLCPFVNRECNSECRAYDDTKKDNCLVLHRLDRTNMILNYIEKKIDLLKAHYRRAQHATISRVLITTVGADDALLGRAYFDRILTLEDLRSTI